VGLKTIAPRIATLDPRRAKPPPKTADAYYTTPEHRAWSALVIKRAGGRCQWVENGIRCTKAYPHHRMLADHIVEVKDGGALLDPANGQCLCVQHNTRKGLKARAARR
jgi:hypothetical protein